MHKTAVFALSLLSVAVLGACSSTPPNNARLDEARSTYRAAQDQPQTRELAGGELRLAGDYLNRANEAAIRGDKTADIEHLAYLARQQVAIAEETGREKAAEQRISHADGARDKERLAARTQEADASHRQNLQLEAQLSELKATKTARGLVVTIGDLLFDTDKAQLKSGGLRSVRTLANILKDTPQRKVQIEGFTDSTGSESHNQELSSRRAEAVRDALVDAGVASERIGTHGYGEAYPVAGNDSAGSRQLNRRVEVILSDDNGVIPSR
ncbi:OmpA family protein [Rhodocyclus tenuis]|uniref:OmpA family protein n=1 Tax=Rhodocyclus gracilis TaxID=2929842 RepID=UPI001298DA9B|nr:OmpA family protein [Rhodocyclus gracilis]MRD73808.1 OmpA family protein [Rhodocyclus gracilis]